MTNHPHYSARRADWTRFVPRQGLLRIGKRPNLIGMNKFAPARKQSTRMISVGEALAVALAVVPSKSPAGFFLNTLGREIADARP